jgi:hypothetical protein
MGTIAHKVHYDTAKLGGGSDFFDIIEQHFKNDEGEIYIETHSWEDFLKGTDTKERFPEEVKEVTQDLQDENGCLTYAFF